MELGKCDIQLASMPFGLLPSITLSFVIFQQFKLLVLSNFVIMMLVVVYGLGLGLSVW